VGQARVVAGLPEAPRLATRNQFFVATLCIALVAALAVSALARRITRRALEPLAELTARISTVRPGDDRELGLTPELAELRGLTATFDDLLLRTHDAMERTREALARERRFAAEASHELRTPLTVLRGEIESLVQAGIGEAQEALLSVEELVALVEALLWFSRAQSPFERSALDIVNLADLAREEASRVSAGHPGIRLVVGGPEEILVAADERLLARAVANIVDNAFKYSPSSGSVEIEVDAREGRAVVSVADHGSGVPPDLGERIFEPFFRGGRHRAETQGFGLGLPLARAVARAHGGDVALAESSPQGSRFQLWVPLA
jgi:two-component system OmpR family sensor kinase